MRDLCLINDFYFVLYDNISRDFIFQDDVHLNKDGTCILEGYFVDFVSAINNFWLNRNPEIAGKWHKSSACKLKRKLELKAFVTQQTENPKACDDKWNSLGKNNKTDY